MPGSLVDAGRKVPENRKETGIMKKIAMLAAVAAVLVLTGGARAAEVEVKLLNKGADGVMVFEPAFVKLAPGDTVKFVSTDKGHNAESIKGMLPEGAAPFVGKNNEDIAVKFEQEGVYGIKCLPHYGMGMVAMIVVGKPGNVDQAKAVPQVGKAKQVFATLFDKLEASKTASK
jgi:pseudoazurin